MRALVACVRGLMGGRRGGGDAGDGATDQATDGGGSGGQLGHGSTLGERLRARPHTTYSTDCSCPESPLSARAHCLEATASEVRETTGNCPERVSPVMKTILTERERRAGQAGQGKEVRRSGTSKDRPMGTSTATRIGNRFGSPNRR